MALAPSIIGLDLLGGGPNLITQELAEFGIIPPLWGIFNQDGEVAVTADNVVAFEYKNDSNVADYPLEEGAFESYDKVANPYTTRVTFTSGGSFTNRQQLIESIEAISGDTELYDVVTPEKTYLSANVTHYDYRRTSQNGATLITVTVWLQEIRENAVAETTDTDSPSAAATKDGGQVQAREYTPQEQSIISAAFEAP